MARQYSQHERTRCGAQRRRRRTPHRMVVPPSRHGRDRHLVRSLLVSIILVATALTVSAGGSQGPRPPGIDGDTAKAIPPVQMFDNLYYIGNDFVCAYVLK